MGLFLWSLAIRTVRELSLARGNCTHVATLASQSWSTARSSNDFVHPIVVWVVTKWSKVNTMATTTAGALMRDATVYRDTAAELSRHQPM